MFCLFCYFFAFNKIEKIFSIDNCCWVIPVTSCFIAVVAAVIGIGICFFYFQCNIYYCRVRPIFMLTNTWLECFYELFICFLCYFFQIFCFWSCSYFILLCKKVKGWMIYWVGYKKKKER